MMNSQLSSPLFSDLDIAPLLSDEQFIAHMVTVEGALAAVEGALGIIPADATERILAALPTFKPDLGDLLKGIEMSGVPTIELVRQLREYVGGEAASYVHRGATTQDIMDTALVLQLRAILAVLEGKLVRLIHLVRREIRDLPDDDLNKVLDIQPTNTLFQLGTHVAGSARYWAITNTGGLASKSSTSSSSSTSTCFGVSPPRRTLSELAMISMPTPRRYAWRLPAGRKIASPASSST